MIRPFVSKQVRKGKISFGLSSYGYDARVSNEFKIFTNVNSGIVDPKTGYVIDMKILKDLIKSEVEEKMDHKNLNEEVPEFIEMIPTAENIAIVIYNKLKPHLNSKHSLEITLYETPRNFVSYSG